MPGSSPPGTESGEPQSRSTVENAHHCESKRMYPSLLQGQDEHGFSNLRTWEGGNRSECGSRSKETRVSL